MLNLESLCSPGISYCHATTYIFMEHLQSIWGVQVLIYDHYSAKWNYRSPKRCVVKTQKFNLFQLTDSGSIRNHRITCQPIYRHTDSGDIVCMCLCMLTHIHIQYLGECVVMHVCVSFCPPASMLVSRTDEMRKWNWRITSLSWAAPPVS